MEITWGFTPNSPEGNTAALLLLAVAVGYDCITANTLRMNFIATKVF